VTARLPDFEGLRYRIPRPAPAPHVLVTIDPGKRASGVATWLVNTTHPNGLLVAANHIPLAVLLSWSRNNTFPVAWMIEAPHRRGPDDHAHKSGVEALKRVVDGIHKIAKLKRPRTITMVRPSGWKGGVPKRVHHERVFGALRPEEIADGGGSALDPSNIGDTQWTQIRAHAYQPDVADAIALGLWALGRVGRGGKGAPAKTPATANNAEAN
jgi:hypothetical protein